MKLGAEKQKEVIALALLLVVAGALLWHNLGPSFSSAAPAAPAFSPAAHGTAAITPAPSPLLDTAKLEAVRALKYSGTGRDLFHFGAAPPPPLTPAQIAARNHPSPRPAGPLRPPVPAGPPPPPPIPLKFYGFAEAVNAPEKIFIKMGEDAFVVTTGETIEHRYLIETIGKVSVRVKDLQTQSEQELPLQRG